VGIFPTYHDSAMDFLHSTVWLGACQQGQPAVDLIMVDDLESMEHLDFDARQTLRWLALARTGAAVWPILTLNAERALQVEILVGSLPYAHLWEHPG